MSKFSYDAWGQRRNAGDFTENPLVNLASALQFSVPEFNRGYTGHQHIDSFGLIHMKGRVFDPRIARFLSADPLVANAEQLQSYNRYSYVHNNPLNATDPSGYSSVLKQLATMVIGGLVGAYCPPCSVAMFSYGVLEGVYNAIQAFKYDQTFQGIYALANVALSISNQYDRLAANSGDSDTETDGVGGEEQKHTNTMQHTRSDLNGDPVPKINISQKSTLPVKLVNNKFVGNVKWRCIGALAQCQTAIKHMNDLTLTNPDILDVKHTVVTKGPSDATIRFQRGYLSTKSNVLGLWDSAAKIMRISNSAAHILERVVKHETGHAFGFPHIGNSTRNFMSYHNLGQSNHAQANKYPYKFDQVSKDLVRHYNAPALEVEPSLFDRLINIVKGWLQ